MFSIALVCLCVASVFLLVGVDSKVHLKRSTQNGETSDGKTEKEPLILTPYVEGGRLEEARRAAVVKPLIPGIKSYSGFFTVNKKHDSNMFFWYFPPINDGSTMKRPTGGLPVILWLQGGPGSTSLFGALREIGPLHLNDDGTLVYNKFSWADHAHLVFIDNPVGSGFSYSKKRGYSTNQQQVVDNLYPTIIQFLVLFDLTENPFFITGESYAGKYIPALGARILGYNQDNVGRFPINLQGVAIGNGLVDPYNMMNFGPYLYQLGLIDERTKDLFAEIRAQIQVYMDEGKLKKATELYQKWIQGDGKGTPTLFTNVTGFHSYFSFLQVRHRVNEKKLLNEFFRNETVADALHVRGMRFHKHNEEVHEKMRSELLVSEVANLKLLMDNCKVLLYHGQLDIKDAYPLMLSYLRKIRWNGAAEYRLAKREFFEVDGELAGYYKSVRNFTELLIRDASHMVPSDQPKWSHRMIMKFVFNVPFNAKP